MGPTPPSNYYQNFCGDKYKYGELQLQVQHKYLCPCANDKTLYRKIRNDFVNEYNIAKKIVVKRREYSIMTLGYLSNCNYQLKRQVDYVEENLRMM